ncbi:MAG: sulfite exporter TauE/SafE family protein [Pseudomonadota bacterium]
MVETATILLHAAVALAAFFQTVTGVGFGMLAGPVILVMMDDPAAVVISTLMSWLIALVLAPKLARGADRTMLRRLAIGAALGLPAGLALLALANTTVLKLLAGLVIGVSTARMAVATAPDEESAPGMATLTDPSAKAQQGDLIAGGLGGLFGGALAMPGPTAAARMTGRGFPKAVTRSTMVAFFILVWPVIFAGQALATNLAWTTLGQAAALVPTTLCGLVLGQLAAQRIGERLFRRLVILFLAATAVGLLANAAHGLLFAAQGADP